jgi:hypothetical protein
MTTTYSVTRDQIISAALRKLQVLELGVTPDATTVTNASQALNIMIKAWQTQGIKLWTIKDYVVPLVSGQKTYTISPSGSNVTDNKPLKMIQAWALNISVTPNIKTPLVIVSRQEYNLLGSPDSSGMISSVWYEPGQTVGTVTVYQNPDATTATNYQLQFAGQQPINDVTLSTDTPDFPIEWNQALVWGLADELSLEYGSHVNNRQEISAKAERYRRSLEDFDVDSTSTTFSPDIRMR